MRLLIDTHILLWAAEPDERLPSAARTMIADPDNAPMFSVASIWEIAIKRTQGRADFTVDPAAFRRGLLDAGYAELPIFGPHAVAAAALPPIHRDPFDRILIAQATVEGITLLTADAAVARYQGPIRRVG